jgi:hypothetical protein
MRFHYRLTRAMVHGTALSFDPDPMKSSVFRHPWGWTSLAPILCAIHCAAAPLLVLVLPAFAFTPAAEWSLLALTAGLAAFALFSGVRSHSEWRVLLPGAGGLLAWGASLSGIFLPFPEAASTAAASLFVAGGLLWNSRMHCRTLPVRCVGCDLEAEGRPYATAPAPIPLPPGR